MFKLTYLCIDKQNLLTESKRVEVVTRVKMAKFLHNLHSQIRQTMKNSFKREQKQTGLYSAERENFGQYGKNVILNNESEIMNVLESGRIVEGRLALVKDFDGDWQIEFRAYRRKPQQRKNWLIRKLEHGWVKESVERIKVYESIPKELGTVRVMAVIDRETQEAKDALVDREFDRFSI